MSCQTRPSSLHLVALSAIENKSSSLVRDQFFLVETRLAQSTIASQSPTKRKAGDDSLTELSDADDDHIDDDGDDDADGDQQVDAQDFAASKSKKRAAPQRKSKAPPAKKQRTTAPLKPPKPKPRRTKLKPANGHFDPTKLASDTKIAADNALFSTSPRHWPAPCYIAITDTLLNPSAALQSTAEDFLHSLSQNAGTAQAELINCILRACGCNDSVDADQVVDYDGVVDALDNFTEGLKQVTLSVSPTRHCSSLPRKTRPYIPSPPSFPHSNASVPPSPNSLNVSFSLQPNSAHSTPPISSQLYKHGSSPCPLPRYAPSAILPPSSPSK